MIHGDHVRHAFNHKHGNSMPHALRYLLESGLVCHAFLRQDLLNRIDMKERIPLIFSLLPSLLKIFLFAHPKRGSIF